MQAALGSDAGWLSREASRTRRSRRARGDAGERLAERAGLRARTRSACGTGPGVDNRLLRERCEGAPRTLHLALLLHGTARVDDDALVPEGVNVRRSRNARKRPKLRDVASCS